MHIKLSAAKTRIGVRVKVQFPNPNDAGAMMTVGVLQMNPAQYVALRDALKLGGPRLEPALYVIESIAGADGLRVDRDNSAPPPLSRIPARAD